MSLLGTVCPPHYAYLPAPYPGVPLDWMGDPQQMDDYARFVRHALWYAGEYARYVPQQVHGLHKPRFGFAQPALLFANGCIDWESIPDLDPYWAEMAPESIASAGWIEPPLPTVGSATWQHHRQVVVQENPCLVTIRRRVFSLVTTAATLDPYEAEPDRQFATRVFNPLVQLGQPTRHARRAWLKVMFRFGAGKPFVYYSEHAPDQAILDLARDHEIPLLHLPLSLLPATQREAHRTFLFALLSSAQYLTLREHY